MLSTPHMGFWRREGQSGRLCDCGHAECLVFAYHEAAEPAAAILVGRRVRDFFIFQAGDGIDVFYAGEDVEVCVYRVKRYHEALVMRKRSFVLGMC